MFNDVEESRTYILHMISEHRRLHAAVMAIEQRWHAVGMKTRSQDALDDLRSSLEQLRNELQQHFTSEEGGGCIEEAVTRCPSLSQDAVKIEREHTFLLQQLDQVIQRLSQSVDSESLDTAHREFQEFFRRLQIHENAEDEILERGFGVG